MILIFRLTFILVSFSSTIALINLIMHIIVVEIYVSNDKMIEKF